METLVLELYAAIQALRAEGIDPREKYGDYLVSRIEDEFNKIDKDWTTRNTYPVTSGYCGTPSVVCPKPTK